MTTSKEKSPKRSWQGTTFGTGWMHEKLIAVLQKIDVRVIYAFSAVFIIPVCLLLNTNRSRTAAYRYFRGIHGWGRLKSAWGVYVNHCLFSQVVIDRFALYAGKHFDVRIEGVEHFNRLVEQKECSVILSAHVGNYELAGYSLEVKDKSINALVFAHEKESVMKSREKMFGTTNVNMIAMQEDMSHLFEINEALSNGQIVSFPADRTAGSPKTLTAHLLGRPAKFPVGPFAVASSHKADVVGMNVMKTGSKQYTIVVSPLPYDKTLSRREQMQGMLDAYAAQLTKCMMLYPEQWYNYFDFWNYES